MIKSLIITTISDLYKDKDTLNKLLKIRIWKY